ncbi:hypothetical protein NUW58_g4384 [Xylaria curta]|uniref:Uncharacterized protein n=1 Tax=Xylaria curta TaxID=42375 RepID=A0ACC1P9K7_9PEZI|nr:hypothetical protein NUW58_g4384 [Xylaria curta]
MPSHKVPLTFTFHRKGAHPPLFVAGSFSDPPWQPLEMDASLDQHGDLIFTKQVMVDECSEVQYKFRHASGDWWALDPDAETVTDEHGNVNSLLRSPTKLAAQETTLGKSVRAIKIRDTAASNVFSIADDAVGIPNSKADTNIREKLMDTADIDPLERPTENDQLRRLSFTPIEEVANTAAEVADSASQLDDGDFEVDNSDTFPMFSHERFISTPDTSPSSHEEPTLQHGKLDHYSDSANQINFDYDDPQLEHFPSDRQSIMATMRRLSTTIDADPTIANTPPLPPITIAKPFSWDGRFLQNYSTVGETNTTEEQTEDVSRLPPSILTCERSLLSIAEGEEAPDESETPNRAENASTPTQYVGPVEIRNLSLVSSGSSNEDEGISMRISSRKQNSKAVRLKETDDEKHLAPIIDEAITSDITPTEEQANSVSSSSETSVRNSEAGFQKPTYGERAPSPSSAYSIHDDKRGNLVHTFLRTMFVDWIGGFVNWLCSRNRNEM